MATVSKHYTRLERDETEHQHPECGCVLRLEEHGGVGLYQCRIHAAAPGLVSILDELAEGISMWADDVEELGCYPSRVEAMRWQAKRANAVIRKLRKAEG